MTRNVYVPAAEREGNWNREPRISFDGEPSITVFCAKHRELSFFGREAVIATVRIAPIERWCEGARRLSPSCEKYKYDDISIVTNSLGPSTWCEGKLWLVDQGWLNDFRERHGYEPWERKRYACEHMLEMD